MGPVAGPQNRTVANGTRKPRFGNCFPIHRFAPSRGHQSSLPVGASVLEMAAVAFPRFRQRACFVEQRRNQRFDVQNTNKLNTLDAKFDLLQSIDERLDFLHAKADEQTRKNWPIIKLEGLFAVPLADGYIFVPSQDDDLLLMFARATSQGLEPGTRRVIKSILRPGDHAIDVGAGVAMHTVSMAQSVGPDGTVDAFEPEPRLRPCLQKCFLLNGLNQVTLHPAAVGCTNGEAPFFVSTTIGHSSLYELDTETETGESLSVPIRTLDSVIEFKRRREPHESGCRGRRDGRHTRRENASFPSRPIARLSQSAAPPT